MKTTTESDIPELFRQFSGDSANYQELTRAEAARASQARWPLLSAVELDQGDIPAVLDPETGLAVVEPVLVEAAVMEVAVVAPAPLVSLPAAEIETDVITATPPATVVPASTIFVAPAPYNARHFAQIARTLEARHEPTLDDITAPVEQADAAMIAVAEAVPLAQAAAAAPLAEAVSPRAPVASSPAAPRPRPLVATPAAPAAQATAPAVAVGFGSHTQAPARHAGLKPLFDRLAAPEETATPVLSLFSRLMKS